MYRIFALTFLFGTVLTMDMKQRLAIAPPGVPGFNFNVHAYLGQWFIQFRKAPCSWSGSSMFTDYVQNVVPAGKGSFHNHLTWRSNGMCVQVTGRYVLTGPAMFTLTDNLGDSFSGKLKVIATDYKTFVIYWGCTKMSASSDRCDDPWISVATRHRFPKPMVLSMIHKYLRSIGVTMGELERVSHKAPCPLKPQGPCKY